MCPDEWNARAPVAACPTRRSETASSSGCEPWPRSCCPDRVDVILEFGFWVRAERDQLRLTARRLGAEVELRHLDVPLPELRRRLAARDRALGPERAVGITPEQLARWAAAFEAPHRRGAGAVRRRGSHAPPVRFASNGAQRGHERAAVSASRDSALLRHLLRRRPGRGRRRPAARGPGDPRRCRDRRAARRAGRRADRRGGAARRVCGVGGRPTTRRAIPSSHSSSRRPGRCSTACCRGRALDAACGDRPPRGRARTAWS